MEAIPKSDIRFGNRFDIRIKQTTWIGHKTLANALYQFGRFHSFLASLGRNQVYVQCMFHVALSKRPIHQFKPVQNSRQQVLKAYCSNVYTVH